MLDDLSNIIFKLCRSDESDFLKTKDEFRTLSSDICSTNTKYSKFVFELDSMKSRCDIDNVKQISRVCYGIMRASLEVNVHFHTNEST